MVRELSLLEGGVPSPQRADVVQHLADGARQAGPRHVGDAAGARADPDLAQDVDAGRVGADVPERSRRRLALANVRGITLKRELHLGEE